jgi:hypothetical protein
MVNKIILTISIFLVVFWADCRAQNIAIRAGLDAIPTSSNDETHDGNLPKGFHAGILGTIPVSSKISLRPEVQYSWLTYYSRTSVPENEFIQGIAQQYQLPAEQAQQLITSYQQKTDKTTSYLFIPVLVGYHFQQTFLMFGAQIGFVLSNQDENNLSATVAGQPIENNTTINSTDRLRNTQFALAAGIESKLSSIVGMEFRYARSLSSLEADGSNTSSYYNFFQFSTIVNF